MKKGKLIVIEGSCDDIGKSTQYKLLQERLKNNGKIVVNHHFPSYNTYQGKPVEMYLSGEFGKPSSVSPYFINTLYATDRAITWYKELKKEFEQGKIVLLDRYTTSSLIYQSALIEDVELKKQFIDYVCDFEYNKLGLTRPDNVIFLYAPFDIVTEMRKSRTQNDGISNDIHESDLSFMKKVYDNAMFVADYLGWNKIKYNSGNKMRSIEEIHEDIYKLVNNL